MARTIVSKGCDVSTLNEIRNDLIKKKAMEPDAASHLGTMGFFPIVAQLLKSILNLETSRIKELLQEHCIEAEWIKSEVMTDGTAFPQPGFFLSQQSFSAPGF